MIRDGGREGPRSFFAQGDDANELVGILEESGVDALIAYLESAGVLGGGCPEGGGTPCPARTDEL